MRILNILFQILINSITMLGYTIIDVFAYFFSLFKYRFLQIKSLYFVLFIIFKNIFLSVILLITTAFASFKLFFTKVKTSFQVNFINKNIDSKTIDSKIYHKKHYIDIIKTLIKTTKKHYQSVLLLTIFLFKIIFLVVFEFLSPYFKHLKIKNITSLFTNAFLTAKNIFYNFFIKKFFNTTKNFVSSLTTLTKNINKKSKNGKIKSENKLDLIKPKELKTNKDKENKDIENKDKENVQLSINQKNKKIKKPKLLTFYKRFKYFIFGIIFSATFIFIPYEVYTWYKQLPKPELLSVYGNNKSTKILDRNGNLLYEIYVDKKYSPINLEQIPQHVIDATIAVEDSEFYSHNGLRPQRILKAAQMTLLQGQTQGASTITQQLVKNVLLTNERTLSRKLKEAVITILVETKYTKKQILELYLNNISYGGVAWGIQSASQKYFGVDVWELDLAQSSMLAGLPSSPSIYSPIVNYELAKQRQLHVLNRMKLLGYITQYQLEQAYNQELTFAQQIDYIRAPHFVHYVRDQLEREYGKRLVDYGGLTVYTSLDLQLQQKVEQIVKQKIQENEYLNLTNGAAIVLDPINSNVLAYVGSVDYFKDQWGAFDIIQSNRQPGSSIKPVTYALALKDKYTPASILYDTKLSVPQTGGPNYEPVNYDLKFRGPVTLRSALANSYNIPPVKLAMELGPDNIVDLANKMGLKDWSVNDPYGISITLGAKEVKLYEHANLFATFARKGQYKDISPFINVIDSNGYQIYNDTRQNENVLSEDVSYLIYDILSDNNARVPAFGYNNSLKVNDNKIAVKTGTTDNKRDNWTMGFTPNYVVGVWVGNNDNTPMNQYLASGLTGASTIWNEIFSYIFENNNAQQFDVPENIFEFIDKRCNKREVFIKGSNIPKTLCPFVKKDNKSDNEKEDNNN